MQLQALVGHDAGNADNGGLALPDNAQLAQRIATGSGQHGGRGKQPRQLRPRRVDGRAESVCQALRQRSGGGHRDLLAQHGAHGQLIPIERARHTQPVAARKAAVQHAVDGRRVGVQVKQRAYPANHQRQYFTQ